MNGCYAGTYLFKEGSKPTGKPWRLLKGWGEHLHGPHHEGSLLSSQRLNFPKVYSWGEVVGRWVPFVWCSHRGQEPGLITPFHLQHRTCWRHVYHQITLSSVTVGAGHRAASFTLAIHMFPAIVAVHTIPFACLYAQAWLLGRNVYFILFKPESFIVLPPVFYTWLTK